MKFLKASEEQVLTDLLETGIDRKPTIHTENVGQALLGLASLGKELGITGPTDLSQNIDKYLYEDE